MIIRPTFPPVLRPTIDPIAAAGGLPWQQQGGSPWSPASLGSKLKIWLRGDLGVATTGSEVTSWTDRVTGLAFAQGTSANRPATRSVAGKTAIDFDGSNDFLATGANASTVLGVPGDLEVTCVYSADAFTASADASWSVTAACLIGAQGSGRWNALVGTGGAFSAAFNSGSAAKVATSSTAPSVDVVYRSRMIVNGSTAVTAKNGSGGTGSTAMVAGQSATNYDFPIDLARNPAQNIFFNGAICEVVVTSLLSASEQAAIDAWLSARWWAQV
jgi:hypothetical protein